MNVNLNAMKIRTFLVLLFFITLPSSAQINVNIEFGRPPSWGVPTTYRCRFYFLPDIDAYYDIKWNRFLYLYRGKWVSSRNLPSMYRGYNLNRAYKVPIRGYFGSRPYDNYYRDRSPYKGRPRWPHSHGHGGRPGYNPGSRPGHSSGSRPGYNSGSRPGHSSGSRPDYNSGHNSGNGRH